MEVRFGGAFVKMTADYSADQARIIYRVPLLRDCFQYRYRSTPRPVSSVRTDKFCMPIRMSQPYLPAALDYRLAPETNFPGPLHDAVTGYLRLTEDLRIPPENIILAGDSAGGGLCLALMMYLRDNGYPLPSGAILMSPWVGLYQFLTNCVYTC
jgi:acetyl esterase/lipase